MGRLHQGAGLYVRCVGTDTDTVMVAQPVQQRSAHLLGLQPEFAGFAGLQNPVVELPDAQQVSFAPGWNGVGDDGQAAARQRQVALVGQPVGRYAFSSCSGTMHGRLKHFIVKN